MNGLSRRLKHPFCPLTGRLKRALFVQGLDPDAEEDELEEEDEGQEGDDVDDGGEDEGAGAFM